MSRELHEQHAQGFAEGFRKGYEAGTRDGFDAAARLAERDRKVASECGIPTCSLYPYRPGQSTWTPERREAAAERARQEGRSGPPRRVATRPAAGEPSGQGEGTGGAP
jgi:hypothetical protein